MAEYILRQGPQFISLSFFWLFIIVALLEQYWPRRKAEQTLWRRWLNNSGTEAVSWGIALFLIPISEIEFAAICGQRGWGLFNTIPAPAWLVIPVSLLILDFINYFRHMALHRIPLLWRFHRTHHTDLDVDFSTALRFHPFEMFITLAVTFTAIVIFGIPAYVMILSALLTISSGFFTHGNIAIPETLERALRSIVVTPDMHRVHHSTDVRETDSNYGVVFPWWDRMFGTYVAQPRKGHDGMQLGLAEFQDRKYNLLHWMLWMPFLPLGNISQSKIKTTEKI